MFPYLQASIVVHKSPVEGKSKIDANCGRGGGRKRRRNEFIIIIKRINEMK